MIRDAWPSIDDLGGLSRLEPDARRADRTRQRCRAVLHRRRVARIRTDVRLRAIERIEAPRRLSPVAIGVFCFLCVVYVGELVATAVRLLNH